MMGGAAYNRGSKLISKSIAVEATSGEMALLRDLSAVSKRAKLAPFAPTVVRHADDRDGYWLMNREAGGWGSAAIHYPSLWAIAREWRFVWIGIEKDACSRMFRVVPLG